MTPVMLTRICLFVLFVSGESFLLSCSSVVLAALVVDSKDSLSDARSLVTFHMDTFLRYDKYLRGIIFEKMRKFREIRSCRDTRISEFGNRKGDRDQLLP